MRLIAGRFTLRGKGGISRQAYQVIDGQSAFQLEFERVNTFQPERLVRVRRLLILGDTGDPVCPEAACERFAHGVKESVIRMVYNEGRHSLSSNIAVVRDAPPASRLRAPHLER